MSIDTKSWSLPRYPTQLDEIIGMRIRTARRDAKMSQTELGDKLGISYQQVQKYEKAQDRVSSSRLPQLAQALGRPVAWFLEEPTYEPNSHGEEMAKFVASRQGHQICELMMKLPSDVQQAVIDFVRKLPREMT